MDPLNKTFDQNAADYRRYRPTYPKELAIDIATAASLKDGCRILEIGCGGGQSVGLFAHLMPIQTSIDIGPNLIDECKRAFSGADGYHFICTSFEDYWAEKSSFDLIYAATSFHWITRGLRFIKSAALLKFSGCLAVFSDKHFKNRTGFFVDVQRCYQRHAPELLPKDQIFSEGQRSEENPLEGIYQSEYDRDLMYTADQYIGLLRTFSGHIALGEERLNRLCASIEVLIDEKYNGKIVKTLTTYLNIYKKA